MLLCPLTLRAQQVQSLTLSSYSVPGGTAVVATVTLTATVSSDTVIGLDSSVKGAATAPPRAVVPANSNQTTFLVSTLPQTTAKTTAISANLGITIYAPNLTVQPAVNQILSPTADAFVQGGTYQNTNYGTSNNLGAATVSASNSASNFASFLTFDLTQVSSSVTGAVLRLNETANGNTGLGFTIGCYNLPGASWSSEHDHGRQCAGADGEHLEPDWHTDAGLSRQRVCAGDPRL